MKKSSSSHQNNTENNKKEEIKFSFWPTILGFAKGEYRHLFMALIASIITGIVVAVQPLVIKYIVDEGISSIQKPDDVRLKIAGTFCILYIIVSVIRVGCWAFGYNHTLKALEGTVFKLRSSFFYHVEHLCMRFHERSSACELYNSLMGSPIADIKSYLQQMILNIPYQSFSFAISLFALFTYDWLLTLVLIFVVAVMVSFNKYSRKRKRKISR